MKPQKKKKNNKKNSHNHCLTFHLKHKRNDPIWDPPTILSPVTPILLLASLIITYRAMSQQNSEKCKVEIRQQTAKESGHSPEKGGSNLRNVVEVS